MQISVDVRAAIRELQQGRGSGPHLQRRFRGRAVALPVAQTSTSPSAPTPAGAPELASAGAVTVGPEPVAAPAAVQEPAAEGSGEEVFWDALFEDKAGILGSCRWVEPTGVGMKEGRVPLQFRCGTEEKELSRVKRFKATFIDRPSSEMQAWNEQLTATATRKGNGRKVANQVESPDRGPIVQQWKYALQRLVNTRRPNAEWIKWHIRHGWTNERSAGTIVSKDQKHEV